jgi:acyl-[acyl carrier protein]--UDP-N-acetylglucosamine O-acyltransferase
MEPSFHLDTTTAVHQPVVGYAYFIDGTTIEVDDVLPFTLLKGTDLTTTAG